MRSEGQAWAIGQLEEIAQASSDAVEIVEVLEPSEDGGVLKVSVSIDCRAYPRIEGGVPLRSRERIRLEIPGSFPLDRPLPYFSHKRYAGHPHVQWGSYICLYQAPETEWQASDGMFGYMERLHEWLAAAAMKQLDPVGVPLHPPVSYPSSTLHVVPRIDTPKVEAQSWIGVVQIVHETPVSVDLGQWTKIDDEISEGRLASAILLAGDMPHEYPTTVADLLKVFIAREIPFPQIRLVMEIGSLVTEPGKPAIFILGAAMRGIAGQEARQHLAAWTIDADQAARFRSAVHDSTPDDMSNIDYFYSWAAEAKIEWCTVLEDRPEIVERRDSKSAASWWQGRHVAILGCGAIGSSLAVMLGRAGVGKLQLYDSSRVTPGILTRQHFQNHQIGYSKSGSVAVNVRNDNPNVEIFKSQKDIVKILYNEAFRLKLMEAEVIVDTTASGRVSSAFEKFYRTSKEERKTIISMSIGHNADMGMMTMSTPRETGLMWDKDRKAKIRLVEKASGQKLLEEFWPIAPERNVLFRPEPGCSHPTFRGSAADVVGLVARMSNKAARWLAEDVGSDRCYGLNLSLDSDAGPIAEVDFELESDVIIDDPRRGYQVRLRKSASESMLEWMRRSTKERSARTETGGILFGQIDDFLKVIWVDEVNGPPPGTVASPKAFVCGTDGVEASHRERLKRSRGSTGFIGMWHTHPFASPTPSTTDLSAMKDLFQGGDYTGRRFLMLIVGGDPKAVSMSANVFERDEYS